MTNSQTAGVRENSASVLFDTGADIHIRNKARSGQNKYSITPVGLNTCNGPGQVREAISNVTFGGQIPNGHAHLVPDSVEVDSAGKHISEQRLLFIWYWADFDNPVLCRTDDPELAGDIEALIERCRKKNVLNLEVCGNVPVIRREKNHKEHHFDSDHSANAGRYRKHTQTHNRYAPLQTDEDAVAHAEHHGKSEGQSREQLALEDTPLTHKGGADWNVPSRPVDNMRNYLVKHGKTDQHKSKKRKPVVSHHVHHIPADPDNCRICAKAKMKRKQARRKKNKGQDTYKAVAFNEMKSIDLVDPGSHDIHHRRWLMTVRDDCTSWAETYPIKSKEASCTADALLGDARSVGEFAKAYRTDNGNEWKGQFDLELANRLIPAFKGLPYRPTTDARHERWHATLQPGTRTNLLQAGLPHKYFGPAAEHFTHVFNHSVVHGEDEKTPYERRFGVSYNQLDRLHPFGCRVLYYLDEQHRRKYDSPAAEGLFLGFTPGGFKILDLETYHRTKDRQQKIVTTRDVTVYPNEFPVADEASSEETPFASELVTVEDTSIECNSCGKRKILNDLPVTCRRCNGAKKGRHASNERCRLQRCMCLLELEDQGEPAGLIEVFFDDPSARPSADSVNDLEEHLLAREVANAIEDFSDSDVDTSLVEQKIYDLTEDRVGIITHISDKTALPEDYDSEVIDLISDTDSDGGSINIGAAVREAISESIRDRVKEEIKIRRKTASDTIARAEASASVLKFAAQDALVEQLVDENLPSQQYSLPYSWNGCVVKEIFKKDKEWESEPAQAAIKAELHKLTHVLQVAEFDKPVEWSKVQAMNGPNERVGFKMILGIKNHEMDPSLWKYKARGCATGNYVTDSNGYQTFEDRETLTGKPVEMTGTRIAVVHALSEGGVVETCDAQSAYCQAPLRGNPKWIAIPPVLRKVLNIPEHIRDPVCRMHKALYGLVRSGFDWADYCAEKLLASGWVRTWEGERNQRRRLSTRTA